ncbi:hypothetical protein Tco_0495817 [Tanacetum coccineum]
MTVGVREMPTILTIRGVLGQARNLLASSVEFKDTSGGNVPRAEEQTKNRGTSWVITGLQQSDGGGTHAGTNLIPISDGTFPSHHPGYASKLFDTVTIGILCPTAFSSQMDITPSTLITNMIELR